MTKVLKIGVLILAVVLVVATMTACGNENWGVGNYTYTHVHTSDGIEAYCATVNSWHDDEMGVELHTKEFGDIYCSEGTYILYSSGDKCPYCE